MKKIVFAILLIFVIFATSASIYAQSNFQMQFPVKCVINQNCWIVNYVDNDSSGNWHDYKGWRQTYDGHTGTDIAIKNISQIKQRQYAIAFRNLY